MIVHMLCSVDGDDSDDTIRMCLICGRDDTEAGDEDSVEVVKSVRYGEDYLDPRVWQNSRQRRKTEQNRSDREIGLRRKCSFSYLTVSMG